MRRLHAKASLCAVALLLLAQRPARAGAGTILEIDGGDLYIDLGAGDGVAAGSELTLLHVIQARDPKTGARLRDTFPIGRLTVFKAGEQVCVARGEKKVVARAVVGDEIAIASEPRRLVDAWVRRPRGAPGSRPRPDRARSLAKARARVEAARRIRDLWLKAAGEPIESRIALWEQELAGAGPFEAMVRNEIAGLEGLLEQAGRAAAEARTREARRAAERAPARRLERADTGVSVADPLLFRVPAMAESGGPLELTFAAARPDAVKRAWLYYRRPGDAGYRKLPLRTENHRYLRARIPKKALAPPALEYFVEAETAAGEQARPVLGDSSKPRRLTVRKPVFESEPPPQDRSQVKLVMDYVDFDGGLAGGFDQYLQWEADFTYRFLEPIYAMRIGFGALDGVGGPKDVIDEDPREECRDAGGVVRCSHVDFSYAYFELEQRFGDLVSVMLRPQFGKGTRAPKLSDQADCDGPDSRDCRFFTSLGLSGRLRIGDEMATNLALGVGFTQKLGTKFEAAFQWDAVPTFPTVLSVQVTDQPVPEDFGVRLIADVWWRSAGWVYPSLRLSYQARDVDHAGVSGGLALNFAW